MKARIIKELNVDGVHYFSVLANEKPIRSFSFKDKKAPDYAIYNEDDSYRAAFDLVTLIEKNGGDKIVTTVYETVEATDENVQALSKEFSGILREWLTAEALAEIVELNKTYAIEGHGACATHEYCDPNQAMIDAFTLLFHREPEAQGENDNDLMNKAWNLSKSQEFKDAGLLF